MTRSYATFCNKMGYIPVPATSATILRYIAYCSLRLKYSSLQKYIGVIGYLHKACDLLDPTDNFIIRAVMKGVKRLKGAAPNRKLPVTLEILHRIRCSVSLDNSFAKTIWAACLVMFFGMQRKSNILPPISVGVLHVSDIRIFKWGMILQIPHSKTNQFHERVPYIALPYMPDPTICPVRGVLGAITAAGMSDKNPPVFAFSHQGQHHVLSASLFTSSISRIFSSLGLSGYSAHSFRRGGATLALLCGVPSEVIKAQGDWSSLAYLNYVDIMSYPSRASMIGKMCNYNS